MQRSALYKLAEYGSREREGVVVVVVVVVVAAVVG